MQCFVCRVSFYPLPPPTLLSLSLLVFPLGTKLAVNWRGSSSNTRVGSMHSQNLAQAELFRKKATNPAGTLPHIFDKTLDDRIKHNRAILKDVIKIIIVCGQQCIALRGHRENVNDTKNKFRKLSCHSSVDK